LYVIFVPTFIKYFDNLLPTEGDGALVGIGVSVFISLLVLVMTNSINTNSAGTYLPQIEEIQSLIPQAVAGGLLGGGIAGFISGLLFKNWQDL
jgi:tetrahydromethanopterin S-methyltransferase subunit F